MRSRLVAVLLSLFLGVLAWGVHRYTTRELVLERDVPHKLYQAKFSADGRYVVAVARGRTTHHADDRPSHLRLWDMKLGRYVSKMPEQLTEVPEFLAWGCDNRGCLLSVRKASTTKTSSDGKAEHEGYVYTFYRRTQEEQDEKVVQSWRLLGLETAPGEHRFAFSHDGTLLAHSTNIDGKTTLDFHDTATGELRHSITLDRAMILMKLLPFPRRNYFLTLTHAPLDKPPGYEWKRLRLSIFDAEQGKVVLSKESDTRLENMEFTGDGEHLYDRGSNLVPMRVIDLNTGDDRSYDESHHIDPNVKLGPNQIYSFGCMLSRNFGPCLLLNTVGRQKEKEGYLLDLNTGTERHIVFAPADRKLVQPTMWLPGSSKVLMNWWLDESPDPLVRAYHGVQRKMGRGNLPKVYTELALFDLDTGEVTSWRNFASVPHNLSFYPSPDGQKLLLCHHEHDGTCRVELWDNPALQSSIPWGAVGGVAAVVVSYMLLRRLQLRRPRAPQPVAAA